MDFQVIFSDILDSIDNITVRLKTEDLTSDSNVSNSVAYFWNSFIARSKVLSHEATKFAVAHATPPFDANDTKELAALLCNAAHQLAETYFMLPKSVGSTFLQILSKELVLLFKSMRQFTESIQRIVLHNEQVECCLLTTGILWEFCDKIPLLPQNNFDAVIGIINKEEQMICDALHELEQARLVYNDEGSSDSDEEIVIHGPGITMLPAVKGMVKATVSCLRKTKALLKKPPQCDPVQLDPLVEHTSRLSHHVDDMICSIYSPMNIQQLLEHANVLASQLKSMLATLRSGISSENEQKWMDFIGVAIEHNFEKLQLGAQ